MDFFNSEKLDIKINQLEQKLNAEIDILLNYFLWYKASLSTATDHHAAKSIKKKDKAYNYLIYILDVIYGRDRILKLKKMIDFLRTNYEDKLLRYYIETNENETFNDLVIFSKMDIPKKRKKGQIKNEYYKEKIKKIELSIEHKIKTFLKILNEEVKKNNNYKSFEEKRYLNNSIQNLTTIILKKKRIVTLY